ERALQKSVAERRIIVSDGVFSMDGDCADVPVLLALAEQYDALLLLDDAHGFGVLGEGGRGLTSMPDDKPVPGNRPDCKENEMAGHPRLIEVGTCGKALGSYGAFILGTSELIEGLRQSLRTMTYSTALPPAVCAASLAALHVVQQSDVVARLLTRIELFRGLASEHGLELMSSTTPIQPLLLGSDSAALDASRALQDAGFFVSAIRPPTVPEGTSRLRITLSSAHEEADIRALVHALAGLQK
ncbi:MAG: aminotransferase class I/II-fold pyridoxal phosphate-dependent enzyme, partial [Mariprofundaceae bacterium]|nr:aminotransferase class I/II-fold pyridoxal phosphate-dependent enzyme [Mariprofundaceae bacterium]